MKLTVFELHLFTTGTPTVAGFAKDAIAIDDLFTSKIQILRAPSPGGGSGSGRFGLRHGCGQDCGPVCNNFLESVSYYYFSILGDDGISMYGKFVPASLGSDLDTGQHATSIVQRSLGYNPASPSGRRMEHVLIQ